MKKYLGGFMVLVAFGFGVSYWMRNAKSTVSDENARGKTNASSPPSRNDKAAKSASGVILGQMLTDTGRVVRVEVGGIVREVRIPATMSLSDEQIIDLATALAQKPTEEPASPPQVNQRLFFYGMAVDDSGESVSGARIEGRVLVTEGRGDGGFRTIETASDAAGRFSFDVAMGQQINVKIGKEPDYLPPAEQQFIYFRTPQKTIHKPDQASPVVFTLTKKQPAETLFEIDKWWGAKNTGEPVRIDLSTGNKVSTGGDIVVSIECPEPFKAGNKIPWKMTIEATGGGLLAAPEERLDYMRMAPLAGYHSIEVGYEKDAPDWEPQFTKLVYLKARNGQMFAKLLFRMHTQWDERGVPFGFKAFVNTNGSRNLQGLP